MPKIPGFKTDQMLQKDILLLPVLRFYFGLGQGSGVRVNVPMICTD